MLKAIHLPAKLLPFLVILLSSSVPAAEPSRIVAAEGRGFLEQAGDQLILHVAGTPYEMGWQHGRLLCEPVGAWVGALAKAGLSDARLSRGTRGYQRALPKALYDEACGLADGAGVSRAAVLWLQVAAALEDAFGGSGSVAVWGRATRDGALYHGHGPLATGLLASTMQVRLVFVVVVARPTDGLPLVYATHAAQLAPTTAMNAAGVAVSLDRGYADDSAAGTLDARPVLQDATSLESAVTRLRQVMGNRRFCATVSAPTGAVAVEGSGGRAEALKPDSEASATPPHVAVPDALWRTGHFVHPDIAATRRKLYHPGHEASDSWLRYWQETDRLVQGHGRHDAQSAMRMSLGWPSPFASWRSVVWSPTHRSVWIVSPRSLSCSRTIRLSLPDLLARRRVTPGLGEVRREDHAQQGTCRCDGTLRPLSDPDPKVNKLLQEYNFPADPFPWRLRAVETTEKYRVHHLTFPSPRRYDMLVCNTVHAEYYEPRGIVPQGSIAQGRTWTPRPALIVLHILDGRFVVARLVCRNFAAMGVPCLMVQMPYYGDRRPKGKGLSDVMLAKPERMFEAMAGAVPDIRRAASWLQARPEVDADRLGLLGVSLGAIAGALVAGVDQRFTRNVLVIGGGDPATIVWAAPETLSVKAKLIELGYTRDSLAKSIQGVDPLTFAHRVDPKQVLMINATADKTIPQPTPLALGEAMGKPAIKWHAGGHYSMGLYTPLILSDAYNFITAPR